MTSHNSTSTRRPVAIGLLNTPPELQLEIAEFVAANSVSNDALKVLSMTSRSLRSIAQSVLFKKFRINLERELTSSIDDLLANPRICASVRSLELWASSPTGPHSPKEKISQVTKLLPKMAALRAVHFHHIKLTKGFMNAFLETAANIPLRVHLSTNTYPSCLDMTPNIPLRISHLELGSSVAIDNPSLDFHQLMLRASATTLTELLISTPANGLMALADIDLPALHSLNLFILLPKKKGSHIALAAFLTPRRTIKKFELNRGAFLPSLPLSALPNLREVVVPLNVVKKLVPGRPVEVIEVSDSPVDEDWIGEEFAQSTARVRTFRIDSPELLPKMVRRIGTSFPYLESLQLTVFRSVSGVFAPYRYLGSFPLRKSLKSSKLSLPSSASRTYT